MNGYIVTKKITLNGKNYAAGDIIPADAVLPSRVPALLRTQTIAQYTETATESAQEAQDGAETVEGVSLPINTENGVLELPVSREDIVKAVEVFQMNADEAASAIAEIESENALIVINACDSRKTVQKAAKTRAEEIASEDTAAETGGDE
ncbi:MAG: hypothetical protein LUD19_03500 [Clostridia bacterium]|nr:hypothetical protein [Clostridia bacterium]